MNKCIGIINLDENESKMGELVNNRPLAAIPIAARYRVIDFVLSNMTNSGIENIGIFTKRKSRALINHLSNGRPWDLNKKRDGLRVFNFEYEGPEKDDVHNFADNIEFIKYSRCKYIIMSSSYMVCNIDYNDVLKSHINSKNDITVVCKEVENTNNSFLNCDILNINKDGKVLSVGENIGKNKKGNNFNMEMYILSAELFIEIVEESIRSGQYKKIKNYIRSNLDKLNVGTYMFKGYTACINSLESYYTTNMDLLKNNVSNELFFGSNQIYTKAKDEAPTNYTESSNVKNSIIANGCCIEGTVKNSIIGRRVHVSKGARVENCIILQNSIIGRNCTINKVIADKGSEIKAGENYIGAEGNLVFIKISNIL